MLFWYRNWWNWRPSLPRKKNRNSHQAAEKQCAWRSWSWIFPDLPERGCLIVPYVQTTQDAQSKNFCLFQGAAFLGTGNGGSCVSTAEYRTSGMLSFSWKWSQMTTSHLFPISASHRRKKPHILRNTKIPVTWSICTSTWKFCCFTVVLDQDDLETWSREGDLASCLLWTNQLISVVGEDELLYFLILWVCLPRTC